MCLQQFEIVYTAVTGVTTRSRRGPCYLFHIAFTPGESDLQEKREEPSGSRQALRPLTVDGADEGAAQEARGIDLAWLEDPLAPTLEQQASGLGKAGGGGGLDRLETAGADATGVDDPGILEAAQSAVGGPPLDCR